MFACPSISSRDESPWARSTHVSQAFLVRLTRSAAIELKLHASRDFLYAVLFGTLPFLAWRGSWWAVVLLVVVIVEIVLTLWDFVAEITVRKSLGDVYAGERVTHAIMGILYGGMLAFLAPVVSQWRSMPTGLQLARPEIPETLRWILVAMAVGVLLSGLRDLYAAFGLPHGGWPWNGDRPVRQGVT
jgi:hypothetical protein